MRVWAAQQPGPRKRSTKSQYASDFRAFTRWCGEVGLVALPSTPEAVALYLRQRAKAGAGLRPLKRIRSAIAFAHELADALPTRSVLVSAVIRAAAQEKAAEGVAFAAEH